jgi:Cof subfamily protein (haloacid dehalogenase superfamily)
MKAYAKQLKLHEYGGYVLSFNGGKVINCKTGETVFKKPIPNSYLKPIYDYATNNGLGMVTYKDDVVLTGTEIDEYMEYEARLNSMVIHKVDNFLETVDFDMTKCLLTATPDKAEKFEKELAELLSPELNVFRSEPYFIEITIKGVDKAESIDKLVGILGMKQEDTICCGDGFNDLTMVQYGGIGVAMDNAQKIVKDNADYITSSCDEDGIVQVIKEFIL